MEFIAIGFLFGVCFSFIVAGAGVIYDDRMHKRKSNDDSDMRFYVLSRDRIRKRDHNNYNGGK